MLAPLEDSNVFLRTLNYRFFYLC